MDSIQITTGVKRIAINDDPERVIAFNPHDIAFAERFYALMQNFEGKQREYAARAEALDQDIGVDDNGLPVNLGERIAFMRDICEYYHAQIDALFGDGTAFKVFDGALGLEMIQQFFEGITPFIQHVRQEKVAKYQPRGKGRAKVMK